MLKSISSREFPRLLMMLKDYTNHLAANSNSLMTKFFGAYKLEWNNPDDTKYGRKKLTKSYIIVMDNLFKNFDTGLKFDLKGSVKSRDRLEGD